jgi:hypothetical protein
MNKNIVYIHRFLYFSPFAWCVCVIFIHTYYTSVSVMFSLLVCVCVCPIEFVTGIVCVVAVCNIVYHYCLLSAFSILIRFVYYFKD